MLSSAPRPAAWSVSMRILNAAIMRTKMAGLHVERKRKESRQGGFVDVVEFLARGGSGGSGAGGFEPARGGGRGKAIGGDGGAGGSVVLVPDAHCVSLHHIAGHSAYSGEAGRHGGRDGCTGRTGTDMCVRVPLGCVVSDITDYTKDAAADATAEEEQPSDEALSADDWRPVRLEMPPVKPEPLPSQDLCDALVVVPGGRGGRGNARAPSPNATEAGQRGGERRVRVELQTIADVGLVGAPNAGKSSLLAAITAARPAVASYAFTTLRPHIGVVFPEFALSGPSSNASVSQSMDSESEHSSVPNNRNSCTENSDASINDSDNHNDPNESERAMDNEPLRVHGQYVRDQRGFESKPFTVADIPGLIEDAHEGKGLGHDFLRHVVRARTLTLVVDASAAHPGDDARMVLSELEAYRTGLSLRVRVIVANKADLFRTAEDLAAAVDAIGAAVRGSGRDAIPVLPVSAMHSLEVGRVVCALQQVLFELQTSI